jgi:hypothetical protein
MHRSLCPDQRILPGLLRSFAPYSVSALAGRHDDRDHRTLTSAEIGVLNMPFLQAKKLRKPSQEKVLLEL